MPTNATPRKTATVSTTDATVTTCGSYTLPDETVIIVKAYVVGRTTGGVAANYIRCAGAQREAAGAAALVGAVDVTGWFHTGADAGASLWVCTLDVSSNDVRVRVTGAAATTIAWRSMLEIEVLTP